MAARKQETAVIAELLAKLTPRQLAVLMELLREAQQTPETLPLTEAREKRRIAELFDEIPEDKRKLVDGLLNQAARLRVRLNELHRDIEENGMTELFRQSEKVEPYTRERPEAGLFIKMDKSYQAIIRQLTELLPDKAPRKADDLDDFLGDDG